MDGLNLIRYSFSLECFQEGIVVHRQIVQRVVYLKRLPLPFLIIMPLFFRFAIRVQLVSVLGFN